MGKNADEDSIEFLVPDFAGAKRERWEEVKRHKEFVSKSIEYWSKDYCKTNSHFSRDMMNFHYEILSQIESFQDHLENPTTVCMPKMKIQYHSR